MICKILSIILILSTSLLPNSATFSGTGIISTGWRDLDCSENCLLTKLILENVTQESTSKDILPGNISWDIIDYQGNQFNKINVTRVNFTREIDVDPLNFSYMLIVWVNESFGLVSIKVSRTDQLFFESITINSTNLETLNLAQNLVSTCIYITFFIFHSIFIRYLIRKRDQAKVYSWREQKISHTLITNSNTLINLILKKK